MSELQIEQMSELFLIVKIKEDVQDVRQINNIIELRKMKIVKMKFAI